MPEIGLLEARGMTANAMLVKLEETFPPINPIPEDTMEKIMYRSGQRQLLSGSSTIWMRTNGNL